MRLFADENIARAIVQWLRDAGHHVSWAAERTPGEDDEVWLQLAETERRLIITSDKDFGDLVFRDGLNSQGVLLLRLESLSMEKRIERIAAAWSVIEASGHGHFIVVSEKKARVRRMTKGRNAQ